MVSLGSRLVELLPHYLAMIAVMFAVLLAIQELYGDIGFWASFAVAIVIAAVYPFAARRLGIAPETWER